MPGGGSVSDGLAARLIEVQVRNILILCALMVGAPWSELEATGVRVAITPAAPEVQPGSEFDLHLVVTQAGPAFDGYHAIIGFDSSALTFVQQPASAQEGSLMTGACGSTFHHFSASAYELDISHAIQCAGVTLTGPGELYVLRFRAATEVQQTTVFFVLVEFVNAGNPVLVESSDPSVILIGRATDARSDRDLRPWCVTLGPNPLTSSGALRVQVIGQSPEFVLVSDVRGRIVGRQPWPSSGSDSSRFVWRPLDDAGRRLPSGIYFVTVGSHTQRVTKRISLVD